MTKIERYPHYIGLDDRETAAVLAGLRLLQIELEDDQLPTDGWVWDILTNAEAWPEPTQESIEALCERTNMNTTLSDPNHPQYDKGFDNGWRAGRRDAYADIFTRCQAQLCPSLDKS